MTTASPDSTSLEARGYEAIFLLNCPLGPPSLRKNWRFKAKELRVIDGLLQTYNELFCMAWGQIHAHSKRH